MKLFQLFGQVTPRTPERRKARIYCNIWTKGSCSEGTVQRTDSRPWKCGAMATWQHDNITFKKIFSGKFCGLQKPENSSFFKNLFCVVLFGRQDIVGRVSHTFWMLNMNYKGGLQNATERSEHSDANWRVGTIFLQALWKFTRICLQHKTEDTESFSLSVRVLVPQISCFRSTHLNGKNTGVHWNTGKNK